MNDAPTVSRLREVSPRALRDGPFALRRGEHQRVMRAVDQLERLGVRLEDGDAAIIDTHDARHLMRIFEDATARLREDESAEGGGPGPDADGSPGADDALRVVDRLRRLARDDLADRVVLAHRALVGRWHDVRADLLQLRGGGPDTVPVADGGLRRWRDFCARWRALLALEGDEVLPLLEGAVDAAARALAVRDALRRRLAFDTGPSLSSTRAAWRATLAP